ncbi:MAG: hypothetical protein HYY86_00295 [Candidatus Harrisonbacteria bacterium]|nr:hypothetical protein [Candidatus Harrisonbacteria bacterium]
MPEAKNKPPIKEMKILVCKECGAQIDDMGCVITCKYDSVNFGDRAPETLEFLVYVFDRVESYSTPRSKKKVKKDG